MFEDVGVIDDVEAGIGEGDALGKVVGDDIRPSRDKVDIRPFGAEAFATTKVKILHAQLLIGLRLIELLL